MLVLGAQRPGPGALNSIHDGLHYFRRGALASEVSGVQLENKDDDAQTENQCEPSLLCTLSNTS